MSALDKLDKNMSILVVDDFSTVRKVIKNCLKHLGFRNVEEAETGSAALEKLQEQEFKFIITDWNMPEMSGLQLLNAVREHEKLKDIPFLFVAAEAQKEAVNSNKPADSAEHIFKPFTSEQLKRKMAVIFAAVKV